MEWVAYHEDLTCLLAQCFLSLYTVLARPLVPGVDCEWVGYSVGMDSGCDSMDVDSEIEEVEGSSAASQP